MPGAEAHAERERKRCVIRIRPVVIGIRLHNRLVGRDSKAGSNRRDRGADSGDGRSSLSLSRRQLPAPPAFGRDTLDGRFESPASPASAKPPVTTRCSDQCLHRNLLMFLSAQTTHGRRAGFMRHPARKKANPHCGLASLTRKENSAPDITSGANAG